MIGIYGLIAALLIIRVSGQSKDIVSVIEEVCNEGYVDAATRTDDWSTYLFRGDYYFKIFGGIVEGYPRLIKDDWKGVNPGPIDAALTWDQGLTLIFQGENYWKFHNQVPEEGHPRKIAEDYPGVPNNIDAALVRGSSSNVYFFKGNQYWKYSFNDRNTTQGKISDGWKGIPDNLTAAIRWEKGRIYFFKGTQYYRFRNEYEPVNSIKYPSATSKAWFACDRNETELYKYKMERELAVNLRKNRPSYVIYSNLEEGALPREVDI